MSNDLVTIIIPIWGDYYKFLPEALESARSQTYPWVEVVVEESKTDLPSSRNAAIKRARGTWILPLDADDKLDPQYVEKTIGKDDIVSTMHKDFNGVPCGVEKNFTLQDFKQANRIISGSLYKKEIWDKLGGYDENMKEGYEDWDFWLRAVRAGYHITLVEEPLYWYRQREDSMVRETKKKDKEIREYVLKKLDET